MPRLVVLIPVREGQKTLGTALRSTLRAIPADSAVYLHLDGESVSDYSHLERYFLDPRVHISTSKGKLGVAKSLNLLMKASDSEFVARMDADDVTLRGRFTHQYSYMRTRNLDFCFGAAIVFGARAWPLPVFPQVPLELKPEEATHALAVYNPYVHPTMFANRISIESLGGYADLASEDYDLWVRAAVAGYRLGRMSRYLLLLRKHATQLTASNSWQADSRAEQNSRKLLSGLGTSGPADSQRLHPEATELEISWDRKSAFHHFDRKGLKFFGGSLEQS